MTQQELIQKINDAANHIANKSRYGQSNWIVTSPEVADVLKGLNPKVKLRKLRKEKLEQIFKNEKSSE